MHSSPGHSQQTSEWLQQYMESQETDPSILEWWYRLTTPPPRPAAQTTFAQRELARRGKLASVMLFFFMLVIVFLALPVGILSANGIVVLMVVILLAVITLAAFFNRSGKSNVTGLMVAVALNLALFMVILTSPGGLAASSLSLFDLLVFSELFVASLLSENWVFVAAAVNIVFIIGDLSLQPRAHDLALIMSTPAAFAVMFRPVALHVVVTVVLWLWVRSATQAIKRADRAEVIAQLQHAIAEQEHAVALQKIQLDESIQQIVEIHRRVANGDFSARVPLSQDNLLWQVAGSLNNLLARFQQLQRLEEEYQKLLKQLHYGKQAEHQIRLIAQEASRLIDTLRNAKAYRRPIRFMRRGTLLDPLFKELVGNYLIPAQIPMSAETLTHSAQYPAQPRSTTSPMTPLKHRES